MYSGVSLSFDRATVSLHVFLLQTRRTTGDLPRSQCAVGPLQSARNSICVLPRSKIAARGMPRHFCTIKMSFLLFHLEASFVVLFKNMSF